MRRFLVETVDRQRKRLAGACMLIVAGCVPVMGYLHGGYYVSSWGLVGLLLAVMFACVAILGYLGGGRSRWSVVSTVLLILFTLWTFMAIFWSPNRGDAWFGSTLTLLYLVTFWLSATLISIGAPRRQVMIVLSLGAGVVSAVTLFLIQRNPEPYFEGSRILGTVGYFNAQAAFVLVAFWVGLYVVGSRRVNPLLRGATLAGLVIGLEVSILTQSRGAMVALLISLPVYFIFSGQRLRGLIAVVPVVASLLASFATLNQVYLNIEAGNPASVEGVAQVVGVTSVGALIFGVVWGMLDLRWRPGEQLTRATGAVTLILVVILISAGMLLFVERNGSPVTWLGDRWVAFKTDDVSGQDESRYLSASGSGRYELWRVAYNDFESAPIIGIGTHNYESTYYQNRENEVGWVRQPHSLPLEVLAERGIVGGLLFAGFLGTCLMSGLWKRVGNLNSEGKAQAGALLAAVTYWFVHSSAEWFWQMPAITLPAMIFLAMLVAPWNKPREGDLLYAPSHRPLRVSGLALSGLTILTIAPLFLANYYLDKSRNTDNPWQSIEYTVMAQRFDPLDPDLARTEADLAYQIGDIPLATQSYARAIELNPEHYASYSVLGTVYERLGQEEKALDLYRKALSLNRLDPALQENVTRLEQASIE